MSSRSLRMVSIVALALGVIASLVLAGGALRVALAQPRSLVAASSPVPRQITAIGRGQVNVTPDVAYAQLGVRTEHERLKMALDANSDQMNALLAQLKQSGIADADIQTSGLSIEPRYSRETGAPLPGYQVSNIIAVTIRDVAQAGTILDQALGTGANQLMSLSFGVADRSLLEQDARDKAIADARARAEAMARASGGSIGEVLGINEEPLGAPAYASYAGAMGWSQAAAGVPIQPGQQAVEAQVHVTFELR